MQSGSGGLDRTHALAMRASDHHEIDSAQTRSIGNHRGIHAFFVAGYVDLGF